MRAKDTAHINKNNHFPIVPLARLPSNNIDSVRVK